MQITDVKGISPTRILTFLEDLYEPLLSTGTWWESTLTHMIVLYLTGHMNAC